MAISYAEAVNCLMSDDNMRGLIQAVIDNRVDQHYPTGTAERVAQEVRKVLLRTIAREQLRRGRSECTIVMRELFIDCAEMALKLIAEPRDAKAA